MARGGPLLTRATTTATSVATSNLLSLPKCKMPMFMSFRHLYRIRVPPYVSSARLFCCQRSMTLERDTTVMEKYKEAFARRMAMAGLKPHHRIAMGVSGGPDSMALCFLTAAWKTDGPDAVGKSNGFIDGLLAIIVDHGLRLDSEEEAQIVSSRVSEMGIRCEVARCSWSNGKPKQGHLQKVARDMRYQIFQDVCIQHQIGVLLIAHHADDQAELFILRLSRNSGVLGLAGMAFVSQIFSSCSHLYVEGLKNEGILLVRPLLDFSKEDMYKICQGGDQQWVEDPTNLSPLYARNRIRMSLGNLSYAFQSELRALISACRKTRSYVDQICCNLINRAVTIMDHGYAIINLETLNPSKVPDICLSKFLALVLQYISQRHRPVRGSTSELLLDYICTFPCRMSLTAAGCYLCPAPGSKGTEVVVCCSVDCHLPSKLELINTYFNEEQQQHILNEQEEIIAPEKSYLDNLLVDVSDVYFLDMTSESVLAEAERLNIISKSTHRNILSLKGDESEHFKSKTEEDKVNCDPQNEVESISTSPSQLLKPGQSCYFMNRFFISWNLSKYGAIIVLPDESYCDCNLKGGSQHHHYWSCIIDHNITAEVRTMIESDWLCLAELSKCQSLDDLQWQKVYIAVQMEETTEKRNLYVHYLRLSAQKALLLLKSIVGAARRCLPVLVDCQGLILSIPSIGFNCCPCLMVSCEFKPKVPLGGGHSSFV